MGVGKEMGVRVGMKNREWGSDGDKLGYRVKLYCQCPTLVSIAERVAALLRFSINRKTTRSSPQRQSVRSTTPND